MDFSFSFQDMFSAFVVLFAVIDITGSIPIFLSMKSQGKKIEAEKAVGISLGFFLVFLLLGEAILKLFSVDIESFAVAGSFVLFALAVEMIFDVELFRTTSSHSAVSVVPIAFPLIAGPGALTTAISLRAEYTVLSIIAAIVLNLAYGYIALRYSDKLSKWIGDTTIIVMRKLFGVILIAVGVKLLTGNLAVLIKNVSLAM